MKKLLFLFAACAMFLQTQAQNRVTKEQARVYLAQGMSSFTTSVKPAFKKGQTFAQFEKALLGKAKNSKQGRELLKKAFDYIVSGTPRATINAKDSGSEMAQALATIESIKKLNPKTVGAELFGATTGGVNPFPNQPTTQAECDPWWDILCHVKNLIVFIGENQNTVCMIAAFFGHACPQIQAVMGGFTF